MAKFIYESTILSEKHLKITIKKWFRHWCNTSKMRLNKISQIGFRKGMSIYRDINEEKLYPDSFICESTPTKHSLCNVYVMERRLWELGKHLRPIMQYGFLLSWQIKKPIDVKANFWYSHLHLRQFRSDFQQPLNPKEKDLMW